MTGSLTPRPPPQTKNVSIYSMIFTPFLPGPTPRGVYKYPRLRCLRCPKTTGLGRSWHTGYRSEGSSTPPQLCFPPLHPSLNPSSCPVAMWPPGAKATKGPAWRHPYAVIYARASSRTEPEKVGLGWVPCSGPVIPNLRSYDWSPRDSHAGNDLLEKDDRRMGANLG